MIDIRNFHSNLSNIDKKYYKDTDIYNIGYNTIKKFSNCDCDYDNENICSVNSLYLIIHSATGYFMKKNMLEFLDNNFGYGHIFAMVAII